MEKVGTCGGSTLTLYHHVPAVYVGSTPHPRCQWQMKVFYRDSLLKMVHNPGGDWHPGWGVDLMYMVYTGNMRESLQGTNCDRVLSAPHFPSEIFP